MSKKIIVTHSGGFHSDDLFAVATLEMILGEIEIIRSRDEEDFERADYIVDVGGEYDPENNKFDHHQKGGAGSRENNIPYASFGLIWKKYGEELAGGQREAKLIDERLVQPIDAGDNGHEIYKLISDIRPYTIQSIFGIFEPVGNEEKSYDQAFKETLPLAKKILSREIELASEHIKAEDEIRKVYENTEDKKIIVLREEFTDRGTVGNVLSKYPEPIYAVFYGRSDESWRVLAISTEPGTYEQRKPLPESWRASNSLEDLTGISGIKFVHNSGFMAVTENKESAVKLAKLALET